MRARSTMRADAITAFGRLIQARSPSTKQCCDLGGPPVIRDRAGLH